MVESVPNNLLIVNARPGSARMALKAAAAAGIRGEVAVSASRAVEKLDSGRWDMVLADMDTLGDGAGRFIGLIKADRPEMPLVMISAPDRAEDVLKAVRAGCDEFLIEPLTIEAVQAALAALLPGCDVALPLAARVEGRRSAGRIIGKARRFLQVLRMADKVAATSIPVLITGPSGTGKELLAGYIQSRSRRRRGPYVRVNCAALSDTLLESELFGHERGAFTGAHQRRKGLFERAHGGTLLLDEISETPAGFQAKLLRVIEEQDFQRVGGNESVKVNVRVISTSNRDLEAEADKGRFRRDLLYRISGLNLPMPPLRERKEDIEPLVWHFVNRYGGEARRDVASIAPETLETLIRFDWPGNVRQLCSVVRTALVMGEGPVLTLDGVECLPAASGEIDDSGTVRLRDVERQAIIEALRRTKSHYTKAADMLGITDRTLREKVRRYRRDGQLAGVGEKRWLTQTT